MTIINNKQLDNRISKIVLEELKKVNNKIDALWVALQHITENIKCMEKKMKNKIDEFELADLENDAKKEEEYEKKLKEEGEEIEEQYKCDYCGGEFDISDLDYDVGDDGERVLICRNCEADLDMWRTEKDE